MLDTVAQLGIKYMVFSNGELLDERFYDSLFAAAVAVRFSVDAATPETHSRWHAANNSRGRGRADFRRVTHNIGQLVAEKRRRRARYPDIGCQMICSKLTENDFEKFAQLFRDIGVDYIVYKPLQRNEINKSISVSSLDLHSSEEERDEQARRMVEELQGIARRYQTESFFVHVKTDQIERAYVKEFNDGERYDRCLAHPLAPMIEPDGNVYLCIDHGGDPRFVIGNIYHNTIDEIWRSTLRQRVIARIDLSHSCPAGCFLDETNLVLHQVARPDPALHHELI